MALVITAFGYASAEEVTISAGNFVSDASKTGSLPESKSIDGFKFTFAKNSGGTAPAYNKAGDARLYAKNSVVVESTESNIQITKIVFNISSQGKTQQAEISATTGEMAVQSKGGETISWTGSTSTVTFTVGDANTYGTNTNKSAGQLCFNSVVITYEVNGASKADAELSFADTEFSVELGEEFTAPALENPNNLAVTYTSSDEAVATVDAEGNVTVKAVGTTVITASSEATDEFKAGEASYALTVMPANIVYNVNLKTTKDFTFEGQEESYPWSYDTTYGLKGSAYISGSQKVTDVVAASPVIDLTNRVAPIVFNVHQALNQYKLGSDLISVEEVGEYATIVARVEGETEWVEVAVPEVSSFSWAFFNQEINLDQFSGKKIQLGFHYISTSQVAGTWEIDEVTVTAPKGTPQAEAPTVSDVTGNLVFTLPEGYTTLYYKATLVGAEAPEAYAINAEELEGYTAVEAVDGQATITKDELLNAVGKDALAEGETIKLSAYASNGIAISKEYNETVMNHDGITTGIADIEADMNAPVEYYNLQGVRVAEPAAGMYLRRQGGKVSKVVIR